MHLAPDVQTVRRVRPAAMVRREVALHVERCSIICKHRGEAGVHSVDLRQLALAHGGAVLSPRRTDRCEHCAQREERGAALMRCCSLVDAAFENCSAVRRGARRCAEFVPQQKRVGGARADNRAIDRDLQHAEAPRSEAVPKVRFRRTTFSGRNVPK